MPTYVVIASSTAGLSERAMLVAVDTDMDIDAEVVTKFVSVPTAPVGLVVVIGAVDAFPDD
jgi:hypothetical protein